MQDYNFFSAYTGTGRVSGKKTLIGVLAAVIAVAVMAGFYVSTEMMASSIQGDLASMNAFLTSQDTLRKVKEVDAKQKSLDVMIKYERILDAASAFIEGNDRVRSTLIESFSKTLPQDILFTAMNVTQTEITLQGEAAGWTSIAELEHNLKALGIFRSVHVNAIQSAAEAAGKYTFDAACILKDVMEP